MKTALFINIDNEEFVGYWNGKPRRYAPHSENPMMDFLARHFAKHLTNKMLQKAGGPPGGDRMTSPKKPEDFPVFMEIFAQCYKPLGTIDDGETDPLEAHNELARRQHEQRLAELDKEAAAAKAKAPKGAQMISQGDDDDEEFETGDGGGAAPAEAPQASAAQEPKPEPQPEAKPRPAVPKIKPPKK